MRPDRRVAVGRAPTIRGMSRLLAALSLALCAASCRGAAPADSSDDLAPAPSPAPARTADAERRRPYVAVEYAPFSGRGDGAVEGQAFLRTRGGDVKFGAGAVVALVPATSHGREWFERTVLGGEALEPEDPRAARFRRTTRADGFGGFAFEELPAGEYLLACEIRWEIADGRGGTLPAGGWAHGTVLVRQGERARVVVTR